MSEIWFTADIHFGHSNIIGFCDRPFDNVVEMDNAIVEWWNQVVADDDKVYIIGDFAMGKLAQTLPVATRLKGEKFLVPGNHDRCHPVHGSAEKVREWRGTYRGYGLDVMSLTAKAPGALPAFMCHFPYDGSEHDDRFSPWRPAPHQGWLLHGHVHQAWRQRGEQINVGIDAWGGDLVHRDQIAQLIAAGSQDLPRKMWTGG